MSLEADLRAIPEFNRAVVFDETGKVVASTVPNVDAAEITAMTDVFDSHDDTVARGVNFATFKYDVHRVYPDQGLVYGRRGDSAEGEGFAICKISDGKKSLFTTVTFPLPVLSARAVPVLQDFCKKSVAPLLSK
eukprot:TRINITY_DN10415_c0_g1_i1.p1 TRINITY_DN10415_c0_g1~~TRINITY_DN10415_c0_g1_i1.p1  ORF type:complete len:134 (+),score=13.54 TRINITY_DN10415_c0_g1_i1:124-525(+)